MRRLAALLKGFGDVAVTGSAGDTDTALELARRTRPDLVLLDIEMPGLNGIGLAAQLRALPDPPVIVFVTAFGRFALDAFDLAATDYLVKPVEAARLREAIDRAAEQRSHRRASQRIAELEALIARLREAERERVGQPELALWLPSLKAQERVPIAEILWIAAERDYVRVHTAERSYLLRGRIGEIASRLKARGMIRVHRSALVRAAAVTRIEHRGDRAWRLYFASGAHVDASRRFAAAVRAALA